MIGQFGSSHQTATALPSRRGSMGPLASCPSSSCRPRRPWTARCPGSSPSSPSASLSTCGGKSGRSGRRGSSSSSSSKQADACSYPRRHVRHCPPVLSRRKEQNSASIARAGLCGRCTWRRRRLLRRSGYVRSVCGHTFMIHFQLVDDLRLYYKQMVVDERDEVLFEQEEELAVPAPPAPSTPRLPMAATPAAEGKSLHSRSSAVRNPSCFGSSSLYYLTHSGPSPTAAAAGSRGASGRLGRKRGHQDDHPCHPAAYDDCH